MIPTAPFGRTGHSSTRLIFGAAALGGMSQERADATLAAVAGWGINHIDTAASYGASEDRLQPWLGEHRHEVFLATKTGERRGDAARAELERSLQRMGVDHVDSIQLHNLVEPDEWDVAHGPGGAVEALARARDEGLVRYIGVTGHGLRIAEMHLRSLRALPVRQRAVPVQPLAAGRARLSSRRRGARRTLQRRRRGAADDQVGRPPALGRRRAEPRFAWYEPLTDPAAIGRAVRYVLADPRLFLITSSDARLLPHGRGGLRPARPPDRRRARRRRGHVRHPADLRRRRPGADLSARPCPPSHNALLVRSGGCPPPSLDPSVGRRRLPSTSAVRCPGTATAASTRRPGSTPRRWSGRAGPRTARPRCSSTGPLAPRRPAAGVPAPSGPAGRRSP